MKNNVPAWIASGLVGLVFGGGVAFLALQFLGYEKPEFRRSTASPGQSGAATGGTPGKMGGAPGGGMGGGPGGGMGGGPGGAPGGGMGGGPGGAPGGGMGGGPGGAPGGGMGGGPGGAPGGGMGGGPGGAPGGGMGGGPGGAPGGGMGGGPGGGMGGGSARAVANLVAKLDLLSEGLHVELAAEQRSELSRVLNDIDETELLSEDDAKARLDAISKLISDEQRQIIDSIELPRRLGQGGAGGGQRARQPDGRAAQAKAELSRGDDNPDEKTAQDTMRGKNAGPVMGGTAGGAGSAPPPDANPFKQPENANRLNRLRERLKSPGGA